jgi:hypothetical protein
MAKNIYVGNLPYETTGEDLVELFQPYGSVISGQVVMDRFSGRSRGFGFVEMTDDHEAQAAIDALNGQTYGGRPLTVITAAVAVTAAVGAATAETTIERNSPILPRLALGARFPTDAPTPTEEFCPLGGEGAD